MNTSLPINKMTEELILIYKEATVAASKYPRMSSHHEAYAVILEELDEYWDEVKKKSSKRDRFNLRLELIQTAAMCLRTLHDLC